MRVHPQRQKVQQVVQIDLPIPLRVVVERQVHPRQLTRQLRIAGPLRLPVVVLVKQLFVVVVAALGIPREEPQHIGRLLRREHRVTTLPVRAGLLGKLLGLRQIELAIEDRVARRVLVDVGSAVANPLAGHEDRQLDVKLKLAHLQRRGVAMSEQVANQAAIAAQPGGAASVRHPRRLDNRGIVAHVIDDPHEAMVEHRQWLVQHGFQLRSGGTTGGCGIGLGLANGLDLIWGKRHRARFVQKPSPTCQRQPGAAGTGGSHGSSITKVVPCGPVVTVICPW
jgi:hypothetical protein